MSKADIFRGLECVDFYIGARRLGRLAIDNRLKTAANVQLLMPCTTRGALSQDQANAHGPSYPIVWVGAFHVYMSAVIPNTTTTHQNATPPWRKQAKRISPTA